MNQADWHIKAVTHWQKSQKDLKLFSEACYNVENKLPLADDCQCSVRTVQLYAAAWSLYQEMGREFTNETVSHLWEKGEISLWRKAPQLRSTLGLSLKKTYKYLETAIADGVNRDQFAAVVDGKENKSPVWERVLQSVVKRLSSPAWITSMPTDKRKRYEAAVTWFANELLEIANGEAVKE